jgi:anti-anti-sigma regulatory factor
MGLATPPEVAGGDHACCVFASDDDQADVVAKFARDAVRRGDRIFYLADQADESKVADLLADTGLEGRAMLDTGALQVMHSSQMGLEDGFDRDRQLGVWRHLTGLARDDGYRGLAVLAEMSWALTWKVDDDALVGYEATAGEVFESGELSALCQYDRRLFGTDMIRRAGHAHTYGIAIDDASCSVFYNRVQLHLDESGSTIEFAGEIDLANVRFVEKQLSQLLATGDGVADCADVTFIDIGGCRVLRDARDGRFGPGRLTLRNQPAVLQRVMDVFETLETGD